MGGVNTDSSYNSALNALSFTRGTVTDEQVEKLSQEAIGMLEGGLLTEEEKALLATNARTLLSSDLSISDREALTSWLENLNAIGVDHDVSAEEMATVNRLTLQSSSDPEQVFETLNIMTGFANDETIVSPQKERIDADLHALSESIADANKNGESVPDLKSFTPSQVENALKSLLAQDIPADDMQVLTEKLIPRAATSLSALNAASGDPIPENKLFATLTKSTNPEEILQALLENTDVSGPNAAVITTRLQALAQAIADANAGPQTLEGARITSVTPETIMELISEHVAFETDPSLSDGEKASLRSVLTGLSAKIATNNETKWTQDTYSTDQKVIEKALIALSNVRYDPALSPEERIATEDYLKVMSMVFAFMAEIRVKIAQLDGMLQKAESQGKLANLKEQTEIALKSYEKTMHDIDHMLHKMEKAKEKALILKIVMPVVAGLLLVAAIIVIATLMWFGGVGIVLGVMLITMAIAMTAATVTLSSTDAVDKMCKSLKIEDPVLKATIGMAVELAIVVLCSVVTLGVGAVVAAAQTAARAAAQAVATTIREMIKAAMQLLLDAMKNPQLYMTVGGAVANTAFSSGMVTQGFVALFKAAGLKDKDAEMAAMIVTMILMMMMMLAMIFAGRYAPGQGSGLGTTGAGAGAAGARGAKQGEIALEEAGDEGAKAAQAGATSSSRAAEAGASIGEGASSFADSSVNTMLQNLMRRMQESLKDPFFLMKVMNVAVQPAAEFAAQATKSGVEIAYDVQQAQITGQQAELAGDIAQCNAILEFLGQMLPGFDVNLDGLQQDSKNLAEFMGDLARTVADFVESARAITNDATAV